MQQTYGETQRDLRPLTLLTGYVGVRGWKGLGAITLLLEESEK